MTQAPLPSIIDHMDKDYYRQREVAPSKVVSCSTEGCSHMAWVRGDECGPPLCFYCWAAQHAGSCD